MSVQTATPMEDAELEALMAELETQTANTVATPAVVTPPAAVEDALPDDALAALEEIDEPAPAAVAVAAVVAPPAATTPGASTEDDELAALEAELAAADAAAAKPVAAPVASVKAEPAPEPAPTPAPAPAPAPATTPAQVAAAEPAPAATPARAATTAAKPATNRVPFKLNHFIDMSKFKDETAVSDVNLDTCMMQQASLRAYHGAELAGAEQQHALLKLKSSMVEAKLFKLYREKLLKEGEKPTERLIDSYIKDDENYQQAESRAIAAQQLVSLHKAAIDSLKDRRDMIIQLGADRREEGKGQVRTLAQDAMHADAKARALKVAA